MEDRYMRLKSVLEDIELSEQEEKTLQWLSEWEPDTVDNIVSIMQKLNNKQQYMIQGMFKLMDKLMNIPIQGHLLLMKLQVYQIGFILKLRIRSHMLRLKQRQNRKY